MAFPSFSRASFAAAMLLAVYWSFVALTPPAPPAPPTYKPPGDLLDTLHLTKRHATAVVLAPTSLMALYTIFLALAHPNVPASGRSNGLNRDLITWSAHTAIPLAVLLGVAVPLRLAAYAVLGSNFTFALTAPGGLYTGGVYQYIQHPGYTSFVLLVACHLCLFCRTDGVQAACFPPRVYAVLRTVEKWVLLPAFAGIVLYVVSRRVQEEEDMLRGLFGGEWEEWHAATARFVPWVF